MTFNGVVKNKNGESVPYAYVSDSLNQKAVYANNNGQFQLKCSSDILQIKISHVSYKPLYSSVAISSDTIFTFFLSGLELPEVLVKSTPLSKQAMLGLNFLDAKTVQNIPQFFGEADLVKASTTLPGISSGVDIYSSINVRGGNRDQNLFIVDGARYYTTSHAGGLLSLFNPDIIQQIDIYKGIAPAKFGGATSSVFDIKMRDGGDISRFNVDIGTLRTGLLFETNIKDKWHLIVGTRISQYDFICGTAFKTIDYTSIPDDDADEEFSKFHFWDIDGKINYTPTSRTSFSVSAHWGYDESATYYIGSSYISDVGNAKSNQGQGTYITNNNVTCNFKHLFKSGLTVQNTAWFTDYGLSIKSREETFYQGEHYASYLYLDNTFIRDVSDKLLFSLPISEKQVLDFGIQASNYTVNPQYGSKYDTVEGIDTVFGYQDEKALEGAVFFDDCITLNEKALLRLGLRLVGISSADTLFPQIEPRIQFSYNLSDNWTLRCGYSRNSQSFHVLVQTYGYFENENWLLADKTYHPQVSNLLSSGLFGEIPGTTIDVSIEGYYKKMENLLYMNPIATEATNLLDLLYKNGEGRSYGTELYLKKSNGKIQWDIAYTLSWSERKFETLNNYQWFASEYDRRHDLNVGLHYFSGKKNNWNLNYLYQSGKPFTMPVAYVSQTSFYNGFYVLNGINNYRMPAFSRLDIAYKRIGKFLGCKTESTLSIMNVFARKNAYSVYVKDGNLYMNSLYRVIPSINLKFYFLD